MMVKYIFTYPYTPHSGAAPICGVNVYPDIMVHAPLTEVEITMECVLWVHLFVQCNAMASYDVI